MGILSIMEVYVMEHIILKPWHKEDNSKKEIIADIETSSVLSGTEQDAISYSIRRTFLLAFEGYNPTFKDVQSVINSFSPGLRKKIVSITCSAFA